ncbi:MAG TPA: hypothetical protein VM533_02410 [Fimbriiglobus sp.]|nr:hypothetical protein [Fimbriiglobus sp.]
MRKVCSGLVLILGMAMAVGQEPPRKEEKPQQQKAPPKPPTDELEAAIMASANHPDVRLAQAKLQMAQAELDQAKLLATQRLTATYARVQAAKAQVEFEARSYQQISPLATVPKTELLAAERSLAQAKAALAAAEAEWQAARGQPPGRAAAALDASAATVVLSRLLLDDVAAQQFSRPDVTYLNLVNRAVAPAPGSAADKLRELLNKRVKLGDLKSVTLAEAIEALRSAAGTDLMIRETDDGMRVISVAGGELPFVAWLDLILDFYNANRPTQDLVGVYVREYGLLLERPKFAPPGAPTLAEFARQVQARDAAPKPEPKK